MHKTVSDVQDLYAETRLTQLRKLHQHVIKAIIDHCDASDTAILECARALAGVEASIKSWLREDRPYRLSEREKVLCREVSSLKDAVDYWETRAHSADARVDRMRDIHENRTKRHIQNVRNMRQDIEKEVSRQYSADFDNLHAKVDALRVEVKEYRELVAQQAQTEAVIQDPWLEETPTPHDHCECSECEQVIRRNLDSLPDREAWVIEKLYIDDMTAAELARQMGRSITTVTRIRDRAFSRLRRSKELWRQAN